MMTTQKHVSVITGASKGISLATANRLNAMGHQVIGLARRQPEQSFPGEFIEVDLANAEATAKVAEAIASQYAVNHLINNVGISRSETLEDVNIEQFASILDLNLRPAIQLTQAFVPTMQAQHYGRIINVSSLVVLGLPFRTSYAAAKAGLISMTRTWASELATTGITVNAIAPGPTETELFRANSPIGSESERRFLRGVPMQRLAQPDEIAAAIAFFASEDAAYITGQTLFVDGGSSLGAA
jgi:NAD(P)-dependent dehydrogenase (short-subunit alcohol dehydrogenase family)